MAYIVDGNNVMGQTPGWHRDKSKSQRMLLEKLAAFARVEKARVTVVFDGGPDSAVPEGSAFHGVKVLYALRGSDADTRIERLVEAATDPRGLTIVTSDRHLAFLVRSRGGDSHSVGGIQKPGRASAQIDARRGGRRTIRGWRFRRMVEILWLVAARR